MLKSTLDPAALYALVRDIPRGRVATYGQLAHMLGFPRHARHVGNALANLPEGITTPWHRVVNADGQISMRLTNWRSGSDALQRILLEAEDVQFSSEGKIDLKRFGWMPTATSEKRP